MLDVTFFGVRGSTPCSGPTTKGYGGNTSCVLVRVPGERPIICDLGTGLRYLGTEFNRENRTGKPFSGTALVSHLHWDHIQGIPFFTPLLCEGAEMELVGPVQESGTLAEAVTDFISPPLFPVSLEDLPGRMTFTETSSSTFEVGSAAVTVFPVKHIGPTNGYRVDAGTASLAYISDCQQPFDGSLEVDETVVEACRDVDVLIHDAQFDPGEFEAKYNWGHCTVAFAAEVARKANAKRLVLYHHDPTHDDAWIDRAVADAAELVGPDCEVIGAAEGLALRSS